MNELSASLFDLIFLVRDFVVSSFEEEELRALQRSFVVALIASQEQQEQIPYCSSSALQWHMVSSLSAGQPLISDAEACSWIQHPDVTICSQAIAAIPESKLTAYPQDLESSGLFKQAAAVYFQILSWSKANVHAECARGCVEVVDKIKSPDDQDDKALMRACFSLINHKVMTTDGIQWQRNAYKKMEEMYDSNRTLAFPMLQQAQVALMLGMLHMGIFLGNPSPPTSERRTGEKFWRDCCHLV